MKLSVLQKSQDDTIRHVDNHATMVDLGDGYRFSYVEKTGAFVTLDVSQQHVVLKRQNQWVTLGTFVPNTTTTMHVVNEHGTLVMDVITHDVVLSKHQFYMKYDLIQEGHVVGSHEYKCEWDVEV